jgi:uncharacterized protein YjaG (DUF416 family)
MSYDENRLITQLSSLHVMQRVAFAASCSERLLPNYLAFAYLEKWGDHSCLRGILDQIWLSLEKKPLSSEQIMLSLQLCESVTPDTERFPSLFGSLALNAAIAIAYTLDCYLHGNPEHAVLAGRAVIDSLEVYLHVVNDPDTGYHAHDPLFDEWVQSSPLMLAELDRQEEDIEILQSEAELTPSLIATLRSSSSISGVQPIARGLVRVS